MPTFGFDDYEYRDTSRRIQAWRAHYMAKGCTATKAQVVAHKKVWCSHTWPPIRRLIESALQRGK